MDNLAPANVDPSELPEGFQAANPSGGGNNNNDQGSAAAAEEQKQAILQQALTPEALTRLGRIKLVKESKVKQLENSIVAMAMNGKLPGRITEGKLIEMLERTSMKESQKNAASISIQRKKYAFDSDDEDDNDDDLM